MEIRNTQITPAVERNASKTKSTSVSRSVEKNQIPEVKSQLQTIAKAGDEQSFKNAEAFRSTSSYDEPNSGKVKGALDAYSSLDREDKRDQLRSMMGVDLYA